MKKGIKILISIIIIIFIYLLLRLPSSPFYSVNNIFNSLKAIDNSCNSDADCVMAQVDCSPCAFGSKGVAVNKNYKPLCPFKPGSWPCPQALPEWYGYAAVCKNNRCVKGESLYNR